MPAWTGGALRQTRLGMRVTYLHARASLSYMANALLIHCRACQYSGAM